jgi:hypothetical protein
MAETKFLLLSDDEKQLRFCNYAERLKIMRPQSYCRYGTVRVYIFGNCGQTSDIEQLEHARADAFSILKNDPDLLLGDYRVIAMTLEEAPLFPEITFKR